MQRNAALDILKLLMALMIVGFHAGFLKETSALAEYLTSEGLFRIAVPVFLIINGYYFYAYLNEQKQGIWLKRIFILYCFWMLFYSYSWFSIPDLSLQSIIDLLGTLLIGYHHLWYVSGMFGAALLIILLRNLSTRGLVILVLSTFALGVFIQYAGNYHLFANPAISALSNEHWTHRNFLLFSFPFFTLGYLIYKHKLQEQLSNTMLISMLFIGLSLLITESLFNFYQLPTFTGFDNFLSLAIICPALFLLFSKHTISGASKNIALYASAIYFIHPFVLSVISKLLTLDRGTLLSLSAIVLSFMAAFILIKLNQRLKFIL